MGSLSDSPTMGRSVQLCLAALLCCGIQGASLPYQDGYEFHFNHMGVRLDLAMKDLNPLVGGKAHVELPISPVWNLLQKDAQLLRPVINILEKTSLPICELLDTKVPSIKPVLIRLEQLEKIILGRIYDVMTVKADMTFNAERVLKGIFNVAVDYTIVHKDGTEEKATVLIQGKNVSGKLVTSLEIIPKNNVVVPKRIVYPMEMIFTSNWPNAHTLTIKGDLGKILVNIANDMNEVSERGVVEYLGQQYKYSTILSIRQRSFTARVEGPSQKTHEIKHSFHGEGMFTMKMYLLNGFPRIEITGNIPPECQLFYAGVFQTEMIVNNWFNYEIKHIFNEMEMLNVNLAVNNGRIEMHYQPTNEEKHLEGGNIKIVAMRDNNPIMKIGGYYGLTLDSTKYEILLKNVYINMMNKEVTVVEGITFSELKYSGRIFFDRMNRNKFLPKVSMEAKIQKDEKMVFHYLFTTVETPYKLLIFYPYLFHDILNLNAKKLEITHEHVTLGNKQVITTQCNLTNKRMIATITPTMMSVELFDREVSLVKYVTELTKVDVGANSLLWEGHKIVQFNAYHPCFLPEALCFNKLMTKFHLEVVDKATGKVNINAVVTKDNTELVNAVINNLGAPYKIVLRSSVLPLEMRVDYDQSAKAWNVMINNKSYMMVKPTIANEVEVFIRRAPLFKVALLGKELRITTTMRDMPQITSTITWKKFSLFQNTLGIEILVGRISHKTILSWNINMLRKGFADIKVIGSGTELLGDYEIVGHKNWNIIGLENIDVEWTGKVVCTGIKLLKTPMLTEGKLLFKNFVFDVKMVENVMNVPYTSSTQNPLLWL